ncbi:DUF6766 family protein [Flavihumibacter petaseus]|uniref:Uncharacterized protein n=1 Tax=Flavihumibacter petaseus NBRC 106054 TaxID=1220578 RepID=A0A0E9N152_9BACT|nr:DUF6766 family protein [Flavihumibacter petaseus]GAO43080.1 hypothetical protein FPE01S_02_01840 [Flavihumibacter petaseus NBRC 106054]
MKWLRNNGLSIAFFLMFLGAISSQYFTGYAVYNKNRQEEGQSPVGYGAYFSSGHFIEATFENWESEFLQMAFFVLFTIWLRQKGSSESKKCDEPEEVDREPSPLRKDAPWPVRKGGFVLKLYKHSLTIALLLLFVLSFALHFYGSLKDENEELARKGLPLEPARQYLGDSRFWFESFQNWQSEFLSVFAIIVLSIFLRQQGSSQSKPVDAPHYETGE